MSGSFPRGSRLLSCALAASLASAATAVVAETPASAFATGVPRVTFEKWMISIGGHTQKVRVGSSVKYGASGPLESITPEVRLTAAREGLHHYSYRLVGPHHEETGVTEGAFTGRSTVIDSPIIPLALALGPEGRARSQDATFDPGTYHLEVRVGSPKHISFYGEGRGKPALVVSLKLVKK